MVQFSPNDSSIFFVKLKKKKKKSIEKPQNGLFWAEINMKSTIWRFVSGTKDTAVELGDQPSSG